MKKVVLGLITVGAVFMFSGCSGKSFACQANITNDYLCKKAKFKKEVCQNFQSNDYFVQGVSSFSGYGFVHKKYNNQTHALLQAAADLTISLHKKYFAIVAPDAVSNIQGVMINTPKEFIDKCSTNIAKVLIFQKDPCYLHPKGIGTRMVIRVYDKQPKDVLTYDAYEIIKYLKTNKIYDYENALSGADNNLLGKRFKK